MNYIPNTLLTTGHKSLLSSAGYVASLHMKYIPVLVAFKIKIILK
jgi:hypothetical protein